MNERFKQSPMLPQKNFGFVFFQRKYDDASMPLYVNAEKVYLVERAKEEMNYFRKEWLNTVWLPNEAELTK